MQQEQTQRNHQQEWVEELLPDQVDSRQERVFDVKGRQVWELIKDLVSKANIVKISIWHKDHLMASIPVVYGGVMAAVFPFISLFSLISLLALNCKVVVEKR
jgi:hypothetical protein